MLDNTTLIDMYRTMLKIRIFEEQVVEIYKKGTMRGLAHLYMGEEAVAVGVCSCLAKDDYITSTHRGHGHLIAKGGDLNLMMAEIMGKQTGYCKGKGGSMHIADFDLGILGANGIVGGGFAIAVGAALSSKILKKNRVVVCFFGDGASNQGSFHESLNLASIWKLPVIFVCENNQYGISVSQKKHQAIKNVADRAVSYNIQGVVVDGMDVISVHKNLKEAVEKVRKGDGPILIECKTYRFGGHHVGDPGNGVLYRKKEEIEKWRKKCPLIKLKKYLLKNQTINEEEVSKMENEVKDQVFKAIKFAVDSPYPTKNELMEDIYA